VASVASSDGATPASVQPRSKTQGGCGCGVPLPRVGRKRAAGGAGLVGILVIWLVARRKRRRQG
jgi:hypothetical protein